MGAGSPRKLGGDSRGAGQVRSPSGPKVGYSLRERLGATSIGPGSEGVGAMKKAISKAGAKVTRKPGRRAPASLAGSRRSPPTIDPARIELVVTLLLRIVSPLKSLPVQTPDSVTFIRPENIAVITSSESRRLAVYDLEGDVWARFDTLSELEGRLAGDPRFFRCHKSFLVNLYAVRSLEQTKDGVLLTFRGKVQIKAKVSENLLKPLRAALGL